MALGTRAGCECLKGFSFNDYMHFLRLCKTYIVTAWHDVKLDPRVASIEAGFCVTQHERHKRLQCIHWVGWAPFSASLQGLSHCGLIPEHSVSHLFNLFSQNADIARKSLSLAAVFIVSQSGHIRAAYKEAQANCVYKSHAHVLCHREQQVPSVSP